MSGFLKWTRRKQTETPEGLLGFHTAPDVKASPHAEGIVLISHGRGVVFSANRTGAVIWNAAVECGSLARVVESLCREFHIEPDAARNDVQEFIGQLVAEGLLVPGSK